jgi:hypothetical protein
MPPDPALRPPFQVVPTSTRMFDFPPGACAPQPDDVQQLVTDTGKDYWDSVANGEIAADSYTYPDDSTDDTPPPDDTQPPPDQGGNGSGGA